MSLENQIKQDIVTAMKAKDALKLETLRMVKAAMTNYSIEQKKDQLADSDLITILQKQVKQRHDSIESFTKGGRTEAAQKEEKELSILQSYLPKQLSEDELKALVKAAIQETGAAGKADVGKVMKALMPKIQGKADGRLVSQTVQNLLPA